METVRLCTSCSRLSLYELNKNVPKRQLYTLSARKSRNRSLNSNQSGNCLLVQKPTVGLSAPLHATVTRATAPAIDPHVPHKLPHAVQPEHKDRAALVVRVQRTVRRAIVEFVAEIQPLLLDHRLVETATHKSTERKLKSAQRSQHQTSRQGSLTKKPGSERWYGSSSIKDSDVICAVLSQPSEQCTRQLHPSFRTRSTTRTAADRMV